MRRRLPGPLARALEAAEREWRAGEGTRRLYEHDASLWTGAGEAAWLGWLDAPARAVAELDRWRALGADARGFAHVLVLGMGGSSLAPEIQRSILGSAAGAPEIVVLDSIHPDAITATEARLDLARTLVVVASKSGSTLEPNLLLAHFLDRLGALLGAAEAGRRCLAITDPGSALERRARALGFRDVIAGEPSIGGRFSALSAFGLVPAAAQGIDLERWLGTARAMAADCRDDDPGTNPGVGLGLAIGAAAVAGRDKLTLVSHPELAPFGIWLEQLVAESTGKRGRAVLPIDGEPLAAPGRYGDDRLFVALRLAGELAAGDDDRLDALAAAGQPVLELDLADVRDLAGEIYRWEVATAVAGARLGVDPFDQPDVEAAKLEARRLTDELERTGSLPGERAFFEAEGVALFAAEEEARALRSAAGDRAGLEELLGAHLDRLGAGDYFALLAFAPITAPAVAAAQRIRTAVRDACRVATTVGFGPRYLHSTGQAHKGGPPSGLFLLVTDSPATDLPVPGQAIGFGPATAAQARGDFEVLVQRGRRALRLHLDGPAAERLPALADAIEAAAVA